MNPIQYRAFRSDDLPAVLDLFRASYGGRSMPEADYRHFFLDGNPFGPPMIELALDDGKVVGHYAMCPAESLIDGKSVLSARSMTTMTHPDYAGRGIFSDLAEKIYDRVQRECGLSFVWGFPNANVHYARVQKVGWKDLFALYFLDIPVAEAAVRKTATLEPLAAADVERRISALKGDFTGIRPFARTWRFLKWRYLSNPQRYTFMGAVDESFFAVVSTYQDAVSSQRMLNLVDAFYETPRTAAALVESVTAYAAKAKYDVVSVWTDLRSPIWGAAERVRGRPRGVITYAGLRPLTLSDDDGALSDPRRWRIGMGDSDVF